MSRDTIWEHIPHSISLMMSIMMSMKSFFFTPHRAKLSCRSLELEVAKVQSSNGVIHSFQNQQLEASGVAHTLLAGRSHRLYHSIKSIIVLINIRPQLIIMLMKVTCLKFRCNQDTHKHSQYLRHAHWLIIPC